MPAGQEGRKVKRFSETDKDRSIVEGRSQGTYNPGVVGSGKVRVRGRQYRPSFWEL